MRLARSQRTFARALLGNIRLRLVHTQLVDFDEAGVIIFEILPCNG